MLSITQRALTHTPSVRRGDGKGGRARGFCESKPLLSAQHKQTLGHRKAGRGGCNFPQRAWPRPEFAFLSVVMAAFVRRVCACVCALRCILCARQREWMKCGRCETRSTDLIVTPPLSVVNFLLYFSPFIVSSFNRSEMFFVHGCKAAPVSARA